MRKTVWKKQVIKQALESLSLARSLVKKNEENKPVEKLATIMNGTSNETKTTNETSNETKTTNETSSETKTTNE